MELLKLDDQLLAQAQLNECLSQIDNRFHYFRADLTHTVRPIFLVLKKGLKLLIFLSWELA